MGRKGGGGGTAGGGRSGKRGSVTFNRVVPKFLQNLQAQSAKRNTSASTTNETDQDIGSKREQTPKSRREQSTEDMVNALEREGFTVVQVPAENDAEADKKNTNKAPNKKVLSLERTKVSSRLSTLEGGVAHAGIKKNAVRVERPARSFKINNRQRLSFANSDVDSDGTD